MRLPTPSLLLFLNGATNPSLHRPKNDIHPKLFLKTPQDAGGKNIDFTPNDAPSNVPESLDGVRSNGDDPSSESKGARRSFGRIGGRRKTIETNSVEPQEDTKMCLDTESSFKEIWNDVNAILLIHDQWNIFTNVLTIGALLYAYFGVVPLLSSVSLGAQFLASAVLALIFRPFVYDVITSYNMFGWYLFPFLICLYFGVEFFASILLAALMVLGFRMIVMAPASELLLISKLMVKDFKATQEGIDENYLDKVNGFYEASPYINTALARQNLLLVASGIHPGADPRTISTAQGPLKSTIAMLRNGIFVDHKSGIHPGGNSRQYSSDSGTAQEPLKSTIAILKDFLSPLVGLAFILHASVGFCNFQLGPHDYRWFGDELVLMTGGLLAFLSVPKVFLTFGIVPALEDTKKDAAAEITKILDGVLALFLRVFAGIFCIFTIALIIGHPFRL